MQKKVRRSRNVFTPPELSAIAELAQQPKHSKGAYNDYKTRFPILTNRSGPSVQNAVSAYRKKHPRSFSMVKEKLTGQLPEWLVTTSPNGIPAEKTPKVSVKQFCPYCGNKL